MHNFPHGLWPILKVFSLGRGAAIGCTAARLYSITPASTRISARVESTWWNVLPVKGLRMSAIFVTPSERVALAIQGPWCALAYYHGCVTARTINAHKMKSTARADQLTRPTFRLAVALGRS